MYILHSGVVQVTHAKTVIASATLSKWKMVNSAGFSLIDLTV